MNNSLVKEPRKWAVAICLWLLPPLLCGAAQFVEISAEIELITYRAGETNDAASANRTRTISLVCTTGTNECRIEHDYIRNGEEKWHFDGTNFENPPHR